MKLIAILTLLISLNIFAQDVLKPTSVGTPTQGITYFDNIEIGLTVVDKGWLASGTVHPVYDVTSIKKFSLEFSYKTVSQEENSDALNFVKDYYQNICADYSEQEFEVIRATFGNSRNYVLTEGSDLSVLKVDTLQTGDIFDTYGILDCKLTVNLREN